MEVCKKKNKQVIDFTLGQIFRGCDALKGSLKAVRFTGLLF